MIELKNVTKKYPRGTKPAVTDLSFTVEEGATCVLIGPSGCGKTTTLKMVNRLIEPSGGKIILAGKNILEQDPVELRRNIGYVIQQIGLFPHMTIHDNIATVPKLLGWDRKRIGDRVDELLVMVGMKPEQFRSRYPRELSGGQRQRIGVARALAADPPVMLMDEPFGAIDPITRDRLQNEFLRLMKRLKKTIMFVTHDIDEAIKMGSVICILREGGTIAQYDTPENILSNPADEFVADFVGTDRGLKRLGLIRVSDVMRTDMDFLHNSDKTSVAADIMAKKDYKSMIVLDDEHKLLGYVMKSVVQKHPESTVSEILGKFDNTTEEEATIKDVFSEMLSAGYSYMPVLDEDDKLIGLITSKDIQNLLGKDNH